MQTLTGNCLRHDPVSSLRMKGFSTSPHAFSLHWPSKLVGIRCISALPWNVLYRTLHKSTRYWYFIIKLFSYHCNISGKQSQNNISWSINYRCGTKHFKKSEVLEHQDILTFQNMTLMCFCIVPVWASVAFFRRKCTLPSISSARSKDTKRFIWYRPHTPISDQ